VHLLSHRHRWLSFAGFVDGRDPWDKERPVGKEATFGSAFMGLPQNGYFLKPIAPQTP